jgi:hypothetical protein
VPKPPNPNTAKTLDRILILGRRHLETVLRVYANHYNDERDTPASPCDDLLGGLICEYERAV